MPRARGFTLLEILIVMVLIAILTAAAVSIINFDVRDADAETEAQRFAALSRLAAEEALLTGREYGVRIDAEEIRFFVFEDEIGQWQPLVDDRVFAPRPVPDAIDLDLVLEGQEIVLGSETSTQPDDGVRPALEDDADDEEDRIEPPQLMFLSSGQITPFTLTVEERDGEATWEVEGDLLGRMEVREVGR